MRYSPTRGGGANGPVAPYDMRSMERNSATDMFQAPKAGGRAFEINASAQGISTARAARKSLDMKWA